MITYYATYNMTGRKPTPDQFAKLTSVNISKSRLNDAAKASKRSDILQGIAWTAGVVACAIGAFVIGVVLNADVTLFSVSRTRFTVNPALIIIPIAFGIGCLVFAIKMFRSGLGSALRKSPESLLQHLFRPYFVDDESVVYGKLSRLIPTELLGSTTEMAAYLAQIRQPISQAKAAIITAVAKTNARAGGGGKLVQHPYESKITVVIQEQQQIAPGIFMVGATIQDVMQVARDSLKFAQVITQVNVSCALINVDGAWFPCDPMPEIALVGIKP